MEFGTLVDRTKKRREAAAAEAQTAQEAEKLLQTYTALSGLALAFIQHRTQSTWERDERYRERFSPYDRYNIISRMLLQPIVLGTDPDTQEPLKAYMQASEVFGSLNYWSGGLTQSGSWTGVYPSGVASSIKINFCNGAGESVAVSTCGMEPANFLDEDLSAEQRAASIWGDVEDVMSSLAMLDAADPSN